MRIVIDLQAAQCESRHRGIGRYSLALAKAMVRRYHDKHEFIILLSSLFPDTIEPLREAFKELLPIENIHIWHSVGPVSSGGRKNNLRRHNAELMREAYIERLRPDIIHITSLIEGFGDNAVHSIGLLTESFPVAATFYDVIPLINRVQYFDPSPFFEKLYLQKLNYLCQADLFLAISESSRQEAIKYLKIADEQVVNISAAADECFKPVDITLSAQRSMLSRFGLSCPFIMYSGATDERKNHVRLIEAYAVLPKEVRESYQLALVGGVQPDDRKRFEQSIAHNGLVLGRDVIITGRVDDHEMVMLYNLCALFVFPSWHEGFGLPALEAMSCGAAVVGSNTTSLPEVIGRLDVLFDPFDVLAISNEILRVLSDDKLHAELVQHGLNQAKKFSWDKSADLAVKAMEDLYLTRDDRMKRSNPITPVADLISRLRFSYFKPKGIRDIVRTINALGKNYPECSQQHLISTLVMQLKYKTIFRNLFSADF